MTGGVPEAGQGGASAARKLDGKATAAAIKAELAARVKALRAEEEAHPIEKTGREVRAMFAWRSDIDEDYTEGSVAR